MAQVTRLGRVLVPVADQDEAIAFYTHVLGFTLTADVPFGQGSRWVEVTPPGGGAAVALVPPLFFFRDHDKNTLMIAQE